VEELLEEDPLPRFLYHTIQKIYENRPALQSFLSIVLNTAAQKHPEVVKLRELVERLSDKSKELVSQASLSY
jgi:hypothetical protein